MSKLAEYMGDFAELLGKSHRVHFDGLEEGSTTIVSRVEREDVPKVADRLHAVRQGTAPKELLRLVTEMNDRLANDNATGCVFEEIEGRLAELISLPGRDRSVPPTYGPFTQEGHLDGFLISVGGKDETVPVRLQNGSIIYTNCETTRTIARDLAHHLFDPVRIHGRGKWIREADGRWTLQRFRIHRFDVLESGSLREAVTALRSVGNSGWNNIDDALTELDEIRHGKDEMH